MNIMSEAEIQSIVAQLERLGVTQDDFNIDVVARLNRLKKGLGLDIAKPTKNTDGDETVIGSAAVVSVKS
jgi:hypothetical protein